jgi:VRR-NUC domain-containing protein
MKLEVFPEHFLRCMSKEDRRAIGQPMMAEAEAQYQRGQERELKRDVLNWLNLQGCYVFSQGTHTRTGGRCGTPDILACVPPTGRFLAIELKVAGGRLEPAQATEIERIRAAGGRAIVAHTIRDVIAGVAETRKGRTTT